MTNNQAAQTVREAEAHIVVLSQPFYGTDAAVDTCRATFGVGHDESVTKHGRHYPCGVGY